MPKARGAPICHPEKPYYGLGLCRHCYWHHPDVRAARAEAAARFALKNPGRRAEVSKRHKQKLGRLGVQAQSKGLTVVQFNALLHSQDGKCGICAKDITGKTRSGRSACIIDHDHSTGKVRGLLCMRCNTGLGQLGDDAAGLNRALAYLARC